MEYEKSNNTSKIIVGCVIIAAVAILYFVSASRSSNAQSATTTGATDTSTTATTPYTTTSTDTGTSPTATDSASGATYADGTYTASISYNVPHSDESIGVTLTVKDGVVTNSSLDLSDSERESAEYQESFASSYQSYVVGKKLSDISLSRISGASLTTNAFEDALAQIKTKATA